MTKPRKPYDSDVLDEEWEFVAPYLTLMDQAAPHREYALRDVCDALRWVVRTGFSWRLMPHDFPLARGTWPDLPLARRCATGAKNSGGCDLRIMFNVR